jgi:hypothetical protein
MAIHRRTCPARGSPAQDSRPISCVPLTNTERAGIITANWPACANSVRTGSSYARWTLHRASRLSALRASGSMKQVDKYWALWLEISGQCAETYNHELQGQVRSLGDVRSRTFWRPKHPFRGGNTQLPASEGTLRRHLMWSNSAAVGNIGMNNDKKG